MEAPQLERLHRRYRRAGLIVLGITQMDPAPAEIRAFVRRHRLSYPILLDPGEAVGRRYRLQAHPTTVLIDRRGIVRFVHEGFLKGDEREIEAQVRRLLDAAGGRTR